MLQASFLRDFLRLLIGSSDVIGSDQFINHDCCCAIIVFFVSRCGSRTGEWRTNGRGTPYRGLTLLSTPWEHSWWVALRLPPPCLTPSSHRISPIFPCTTTTPWPSPHQHPHLIAATVHPWGLWRRSDSPSTTTDQGGCLHPRRPFTPRLASCTTPLRVPALFVCTGVQNSCSKPEGSRWERAGHAVQKPTCSLPAQSGKKRWCNSRQMPFNTLNKLLQAAKTSRAHWVTGQEPLTHQWVSSFLYSHVSGAWYAMGCFQCNYLLW